jgi:hypothetical protein
MSYKGRVRFNVMTSLEPGYLNAGLMKPWGGFTPVAGKKNRRWARNVKGEAWGVTCLA